MTRGLNLALFITGVALILLSFPASSDVVRIGFVLDGPWERNSEIVEIFQREIHALTEGEFDVRFPSGLLETADWSAAGVGNAVSRLLEDPQADLIITLGVLASNDAARRGPLPKPVIAPFVIDPEMQGVPYADGVSGVPNLNYLTIPNTVARDVALFKEIIEFDHLTVLHNSVFADAIPELPRNTREALADIEVDVTLVPVEFDAGEALHQMPEQTDAVYVGPMLHLGDAEFQRLVDGLIERGLPSFSLLGYSEAERGLLAAAAPDSESVRMARRTALHVQSALLGDDPARLPVAFDRGERLVLNMETARRIDFSPSWSILAEAELLHEEIEPGPRLTLPQVIHETLQANLELMATERSVAAGAENVERARSRLLPQVEAGGRGVVIDRHRARASFGAQPERSIEASVTLTQLIYSEPAHADRAIQTHLQTARKRGRDAVELDLVREAAEAYLNVLRAQTLQTIEQNNLQLSRAHLDMARTRRSVGTAGPAEVYRWESELANNRKDAIAAASAVETAKVALNQLRNRPQEEPFNVAEVDFDDPYLITSDERLFEYLDNPRDFAVFRDFLVEEGIENAPELAGLMSAIAARERGVSAAERVFYTPDIGLQAEISERLAESGRGSGAPLSGLFPQPRDTQWSIGVEGTLPLYTGGARRADRRQARAELEETRLEYESAKERIEQKIRSALHLARASYAAIEQTERAAESARRSLDIVSESYQRGAVSVLDLLDAQNLALIAEQASANAVYDFLIDLVNVERAVAQFGVFMSAGERVEWFERLEAYFEERRQGLGPARR